MPRRRRWKGDPVVLSTVTFRKPSDATPLAATYARLHEQRSQAWRERDEAVERLDIARDKLETAGRTLEPALTFYSNVAGGSVLVGAVLFGAGCWFGLKSVAVLGLATALGGTSTAFGGLLAARNKYVRVRKERDQCDTQKWKANRLCQER